MSLAKLERPYAYVRYTRLQARLREHRREGIIFCQHPPVITGGIQADRTNLLVPDASLRERGVDIFTVSRGGDYTAHEQGQCVIYPHVDLKGRAIPLSAFFHGVLGATAHAVWEIWGLALHMNKDAPGLYTSSGRKIASIGVTAKRFFTSSGIALNVSNDLSTFEYINPCGYRGLELTTIEMEGGDPGKLPAFADAWSRVFLAGLERSFVEGASV